MRAKAGPSGAWWPTAHILQIAVGVAGGEVGAAADEAVDADGLAGAVVDELDVAGSGR